MGAGASSSEWNSLSESQRTAIDQAAVRLFNDALIKYQETTLSVTVIRGYGLADTDGGRNLSDPFVLVHLEGDSDNYQVTRTNKNTLTPSWNQTLTVDKVTGQDILVFKVYDDDTQGSALGHRDDLLGEVTVPLVGISSGSRPSELLLEGGKRQNKSGTYGAIQVSWSRQHAEGGQLPSDATMEQVTKIAQETIPQKYYETFMNSLKAEVEALVQQEIRDNESLTALNATAAAAVVQEDAKATADATAAATTTVPPSAPTVVVMKERKEVRNLTTAEEERLVAAIHTMMKKHGDEKESEWLRIAGYHGWPSNNGRGYCAHRAEHFPGWHRAYLIEMEDALGVADRLNGYDGNIALPYWDFKQFEKNGQVVPRFIREKFTTGFQFPEGFFDGLDTGADRDASNLVANGFNLVNSDESTRNRLHNARVDLDSVDCLNQIDNHDHWLFASTENPNGTPVETPHNSTHVSLGFPLTSLNVAAFHPMFWLLHCNVDRLYESYIQAVPGKIKEVEQEIMEHQSLAEQRGWTNLYTEEMTPFKKKEDKKPFFLKDLLRTTPYRYIYDTLDQQAPPRLTAMPTFVLFPRVDVVNKLRSDSGSLKSFLLHIFLIPNTSTGEADSSVILPDHSGGSDAFATHQFYAGACGVFGGKGPKCANCAETKPVNYKRNISAKLIAMGNLSRYDVTVRVLAEDEMGVVHPLEDLPTAFGANCDIPSPKLVGPLFESGLAPDLQVVDAASAGSVSARNAKITKQLQIFLQQTGFYTGAIDGIFGTDTEAALKDYQSTTGLEADGVAGPLTKGQMVSSQNDSLPHKTSSAETATFPKGARLKYFVGKSPGYISNERLSATIANCTEQWAAATGLTFDAVTTSESDADITFVFGLSSNSDKKREAADADLEQLFKFDGPGGELARADGKSIVFDIAERWVLSPHDVKQPNQFNLHAVALHELGHVLGLNHSRSPLDVMAPYYRKNAISLTVSDKSRAEALYA